MDGVDQDSDRRGDDIPLRQLQGCCKVRECEGLHPSRYLFPLFRPGYAGPKQGKESFSGAVRPRSSTLQQPCPRVSPYGRRGVAAQRDRDAAVAPEEVWIQDLDTYAGRTTVSIVTEDGRTLDLPLHELDAQPGYCLSVHESQGSEYAAAIMVFAPIHA